MSNDANISSPNISAAITPAPNNAAGFLTLIGNLSPRKLDRLFASLAAMALGEADAQGLTPEQIKAPDTHALLGVTDEGNVMSMRWKDNAWRPNRAPLPSALVKKMNLKPISTHGYNPQWVKISPQEVSLLKGGKEMPFWKAPVKKVKPVTPTIRNAPAVPAVKGNFGIT